MKELINKKIGILGLGEENIALVKYLAKHGVKSLVICDQKDREDLCDAIGEIRKLKIDYHLGSAYLDNLKDFDIVFRSPGLPYLNEKIQKAKKNGVQISSAVKLFFALSPSPIIGVTGTKGKGTTSTLIYEILKESKVKTRYNNIYLAGNIGTSPLTFLDKLTKKDIVVLELSSFQLQDLKMSPHIAVVLDIKSDHLDYHQSLNEYVKSKQSIVHYQKREDFAVVNADYLTSFEFALKSQGEPYWFSRRKSVDEGAYVVNEQIFLRYSGKSYPLANTKDITLRGEHNLENICAAITASYLAGANINAIKNVIKKFPGLEHRLEFVAQFDGVKFYNDSFSTTPDTAIAAIKSFTEPIILIAGGSEKNANYDLLGKAIAESTVRIAILIGKTGPKIKESMNFELIKNYKKIKIIDSCQNLDDVIDMVRLEMRSGDVVLLSPASASFGWFRNYKDRGTRYKKAIINLEKILL